mmetsp:Transcript_4841/g.11830  ORF Transcript_4841/g.11830 Transcript_4841/m.11830 type:complete len:90 (-) Transcript_4841:40-309(-)
MISWSERISSCAHRASPSSVLIRLSRPAYSAFLLEVQVSLTRGHDSPRSPRRAFFLELANKLCDRERLHATFNSAGNLRAVIVSFGMIS